MKPTHFAVLLLVGFAAAQVQPAAQPQQTKARPRPLQKSGIQNSNDNLFVWQRPFFVPNNLPLSRSATCSVKKGLSVGFSKPPSSNGKSEAPERISYSVSDENEADTVSFINLDTKTPIVQSNGGQASLIVLHDDGNRLVLLNVQSPDVGVELYTIFRQQGVVTYSQQKDSLLIGPFAVLERAIATDRQVKPRARRFPPPLDGAHLLRALGPTLRFPVRTEDLVFFVRQRQGSAEWCVPSVLQSTSSETA